MSGTSGDPVRATVERSSRGPIIGPGQTYETVTDEISRIVLRERGTFAGPPFYTVAADGSFTVSDGGEVQAQVLFSLIPDGPDGSSGYFAAESVGGA